MHPLALVSLLFTLPAALAWDPLKDVEDFKNDAKREAGRLHAKTKRELDNARKDVEQALADVKFAPLSRDIPAEFAISDGVTWMAVVGDSSVTGALASPHVAVTAERAGQMVGDVLIGKKDHKLAARIEDFKNPARFNVIAPIEPLTRTLYSRAEFDHAKKDRESLRLEVGGQFSLAFDTEEYAFPYLVGRALNIPAPRIVLAAQDGKKITAMGDQLHRVLEVPGATALPPIVIASFVANDLCHPDNFDQPVEHFTKNYSRDVREQFEALAQMPAARDGTRFVVVAPVNIADGLTNPKLLDQRVKFENTNDATCRSVHDGSGVHGDVAKKLQTLLVGACRGILSPEGDPAVRVQRVRDLQAEQSRVLTEEIAAFNARGLKISAEFATSVRDTEFETGDAANDCFHLSPQGHERRAARLLESEFATSKVPRSENPGVQ